MEESSCKNDINDGTSKDWVDAWTSNSTRKSALHVHQQRQQCAERANNARDELNHELDLVRARINTMMINVRESNLSMMRQNLARNAVTKTKIDERKRNKRRGRNVGISQIRKRASLSTGTNTIEGEDLCISDYRSDDNGLSDGASSTDDASEGEIPTTPFRSITADLDARKVPGNRASMLISAGRLDGSGENKAHLHHRNVKSSSGSESVQTIGGVEAGFGMRKIVYAARTHSQLSQFVEEIRRTKWGKSIRVIHVGGRKQLCGNNEVSGPSYRSEAAIAERCLDLMKEKSKSGTRKRKAEVSNASSGGCPLISSKEAVAMLGIQMLAHPSDIEDIRSLGVSSHVCGYYATRVRIPSFSHSAHYSHFNHLAYLHAA